MSQLLRFVLALHNHQPVGNFDGVIEQAYEDSYRPFLDVFERYPSLRISLHTSGPLMEWIAHRRPEYLDRLARLVSEGRVEILGGAFYEPILTMLPAADRIGQIQTYSHWLESRLGGRVRGMWIPERVWEQSLTRDIAAAGIEYTVLDDFHFKNAGLVEGQLTAHYLTEDEGRLLSVFPGSERLRYLIPFRDPHETIDYLRRVADEHPGGVMVFGDDGEKFGTWPETKKHVYDDGWLTRLFDALAANESWLSTTTLADAYDNVPTHGKIYLPEGSYREMTEWALPPAQLAEYEDIRHDLEHDPRWPRVSRFVRGGFWRNFKVKYPEADEMYTRMLSVSRRLREFGDVNGKQGLLDRARQELYRAQCNCTYWHGAFGGIYLPHLRNAVYRHLIAAENLLERIAGRPETWIEATAGDFNLDARQEVQLSSDRLVALVAPALGGQLYELDVRSICHNLLATLARRPEAYHRKVLQGAGGGGDNVASIHERIVFKQAGLEQRLQYDPYSRKSLLDHFYDHDVSLEALSRGEATEHGDFLDGVYEARVRRSPGRIQVQMTREGQAYGVPVRLTKGLTLEAGSSTLEIAYLLEGLPTDRTFHFASEFNFAGLPAGADDRYFHNGQGHRFGQLGSLLDLHESTELGLVDEWLGIDVRLSLSRPSSLWTFPIQTVSQSEGGFELVHQSVVVIPHWQVQPDREGRWSVTMNLALDTALAESRVEAVTVAVAS